MMLSRVSCLSSARTMVHGAMGLWVCASIDALDRAVLPGGVPAFEDDQDFVIAPNEMPLQLNQFDLELVQDVLVGLF